MRDETMTTEARRKALVKAAMEGVPFDDDDLDEDGDPEPQIILRAKNPDGTLCTRARSLYRGWIAPDTERLMFVIKALSPEGLSGYSIMHVPTTRRLSTVFCIHLGEALELAQRMYQAGVAEGLPLVSDDPQQLRPWAKAIVKNVPGFAER
jgi:hypothetical protein